MLVCVAASGVTGPVCWYISRMRLPGPTIHPGPGVQVSEHTYVSTQKQSGPATVVAITPGFTEARPHKRTSAHHIVLRFIEYRQVRLVEEQWHEILAHWQQQEDEDGKAIPPICKAAGAGGVDGRSALHQLIGKTLPINHKLSGLRTAGWQKSVSTSSCPDKGRVGISQHRCCSSCGHGSNFWLGVSWRMVR